MDSAPAKRRKLAHSEPSSENVLQSATTVGLSKHRIFVLEAEELLEEAAVDYAAAFPGADTLLGEIKTLIEAIEPHEPLPLVEAAHKLEKKHRLKVPFPEPRPPKDCNYKVAFAKPTQFNVVGSYVFKTMVETQKDHAIDMIFVIPAEVLQEKDFLDLRYFYKRAYVLAVVSAALKKKLGADADFSFEYLNGNPLCPILALQPKDKETHQLVDYRIRIIPCSPDAFFPRAKLHLGASLVRRVEEKESGVASKPTPFYNSTLIAEGSFLTYLKIIRQIEKKCAAFKDACVLGRIWLQQRGFSGAVSDGGFGHFEWALLLALLLKGGGDGRGNAVLSTSLKSTQLFKAVVQFLSVTNFAEKPYVLSKSDFEAPPGCGPVIYDADRQLNIVFKMSPWSAALLHQQAKWTRSLLNDGTVDQFSPTFILKTDTPVYSFDLVAKLSHFGSFDHAAEVDSRGKAWQFGSKVYRILKRALQDKELGERARLIHVRTPESPPWQLEEKPKKQKSTDVEIGVLFDPANMARSVDRGPSAGPSTEEKEECEKFRRFWGGKAELRRFEGDTIRETVIWNSTSPFELCEEIMRYILNLHLRIGVLEEDITFNGDELQDLLQLSPADSLVFNTTRKAFADFEKDIRELEDLPLHVRRLAPICPELRHASVKLPTLGPSKSGPRPMETVVSFEASGKWPENLAAIQRTKIAFLLMIGSLLEKAKEGQVKTWVGLEDAKCDTENLAFLDVLYESGASFRLRIHSDLEEILLERQVKDKTQEQHVRTKATTLLAAVRRIHTHLPLHSQTISTFVTRFPALSPTIRLLKQWFNSHKLSTHFPDDFIEIVALNVFLSPYPWDAPSSPNTGFLRALLFLARWDWRTEPLVLDTGGDMPPVDRAAIDTRMEAWRNIDPSMNHTVLFVATSHDATGLAYTSYDGHAKPSKVVATRMTALAKSVSRVVKEEGIALDARRLFVPSLKDYDILLHLNSKVAKSTLKTYPADNSEDVAMDSPERYSRFKNLDERTGKAFLPLAQHPAEAFLDHLSAAYSGALVFFRGTPDDMTVGGIWNPQVQKKKFRINLPTSYKPDAAAAAHDSDDEDEEQGVDVNLNKEGILAEIARIGGDLIEKIDAKGL
ncbi:Nrap protein [Cercophora newfieldiana]|uniref:U3 small nucleolar RNA-associated protein 22 n=1 Tax=Cercophora newfieldiana TaxID=92897 RepID=A0AA39YBF5_9PEZI|nr:Nrap protein [Cercophora newfieldiana]